jgi:pimeloyl-ACP methyl ester carboxylesterase
MPTRTIATPQVTFEALDEGRGPLVLCLHGFPDQTQSFRHKVPALVA